MATQITQAFMERIFRGSWHDEIVLTGKSLDIMLEINKTMARLAPVDDDGTRYFWFEVPRGRPTDWMTYLAAKTHEGVKTKDEYLALWEWNYPRRSHWYFISTGSYKDYVYIKISDRDHNVCIMSNKNRGNGHAHDMEWFMNPFLDFINKKIEIIENNIINYNNIVKLNLPYRQREGSIKRSDFNRILPHHRVIVKDMDRVIETLKILIDREKTYCQQGNDANQELHPEPFHSMSIREFCKYYRIADEKFHHEIHDYKIDDIEYYTNTKFITMDEYNLDDIEDFRKFACDHYGELGLSRMDVHATDYYTRGSWIITFGISYSAYVGEGLEIAMALYDSGAPFILHDAERLLAILEERDNVLLTPFSFHDYLCHHKEGSAYTLPYIEYCDMEDEITSLQYHEIVDLAEWKPEIPVKLEHT